MSRAKIGAVGMSLLLILYFYFTLQRAWIMLNEDTLLSRLLGAALILLPLIGAWALVRELLFGVRMERLAQILAAEGGLPPDNLPRTPGGRIVREAADAEFEKYREETTAQPTEWRAWFRLSCAYDACGDRTRARKSMRKAISLYLAQKRAGRAV